ncbi:MAG: DoxX family membrane protein [Bacteroidota bacterium]
MNLSLTKNLHIIFRIACAMCFIGHGAFGIITKQVWCNYFAVFGIGQDMAYQLMPVVGTVDIICGILFIVYPVRAVAGWLIIWGLFTASLRPLSGEPLAEFFERAGNYGAPLVLLLLSGTAWSWFQKMEPQQLNAEEQERLELWLRIVACTLLFGHGWLNVIEKAGLLKQYASLGIGDTILMAHVIGGIEIVGALLILLKPTRYLVLAFFVWKMASEVLYPAYPFFEWVERAGSYAILFGLWLVLRSEFKFAMSK